MTPIDPVKRGYRIHRRIKFYIRDFQGVVSPYAYSKIPPKGVWQAIPTALRLRACGIGFHTPTTNPASMRNWWPSWATAVPVLVEVAVGRRHDRGDGAKEYWRYLRVVERIPAKTPDGLMRWVKTHRRTLRW